MNRRNARKTALELIYEAGFHSDEDMHDFYASSISEQELEDDEFVRKLFFGVFDNLEFIDGKISENSVGWKFERLSRISLSIMRLCVYEMLIPKEVAYNIAINEAVELAKAYDHDKAPKFINGVLNTIAEREGLKT